MKKRLTRSQSDQMIAGVCGGVAEYFDIDSTIVRLIFAGAFLLGFGSPGILYLLFWVIVPRADSVDGEPHSTIEQGVQEMGEKGRQVVDGVKVQVSGRDGKGTNDTE